MGHQSNVGAIPTGRGRHGIVVLILVPCVVLSLGAFAEYPIY
jgi:hypothetical protein